MPPGKGLELPHDYSVVPVEPACQPDQDEMGSVYGPARYDVVLLVEGKLLPQKEVFCC
jgi:hypothetical protein